MLTISFVYFHSKTWQILLLACLLVCTSFGVCSGQNVASKNGASGLRLPPTDQHTQPVSRQTIQPNINSVRIKDVTTIEGHRTNTLFGAGLVVGLTATGGKSKDTQDAVRNMLRRLDIVVDDLPAGSISLVAVTAELPAFSRQGESIRARASVVDGATSLFGGQLLPTELKGYDGRVYGIARGEVILSGYSASGAGASVSKNHTTSGNVNATVEEGVENEPAFPGNSYRLLLKNKDYATAQRIAEQINKMFPGHAFARDKGGVDVLFPREFLNDKMQFVVIVNGLSFVPDVPARVVINQKTGTVIVGQNVKISRLAFASENLIITTREAPIAVQPAPFSRGETAILPDTTITATETGGSYNVLGPHTTVGELAAVLNQMGIGPRDLISIFQDIEESGQLQATLVIQ